MNVPRNFNSLIKTVMIHELNMFEDNKSTISSSCEQNDCFPEITYNDNLLVPKNIEKKIA